MKDQAGRRARETLLALVRHQDDAQFLLGRLQLLQLFLEEVSQGYSSLQGYDASSDILFQRADFAHSLIV
jgi:hypothetical protein